MQKLTLLLCIFVAIGCGGSSVPDQPPEAPMEISNVQFTIEPSGLKYYDIIKGEGVEAQKGKQITVHYTGWLTDGKMFDSSIRKNRPFSLTLGGGQVIKGWDEGIVGMKVGGHRQLVIPPDMAYGPGGAAGVIPPNATLIFEVYLLEVK